MSYFLLPQVSRTITINDIELLLNEDNQDTKLLSKSLCNYLDDLKKQINAYSGTWDIYKKYTNVYEYIHSIIPQSRQSISKLKPLSRAFYKIIEICSLLHLYDDGTDQIESFHLAEGPGGFIEAIHYMRNNKNDTYYGMTLIDDTDMNIPSWKKSKPFLLKQNNIKLEYGTDNTGNLFNKDNLWYCYYKYNNKFDLITGDGGFDFSTNFNKQEHLSMRLIFCQICFALALQKKGGTFILKIFDIFTQATIDIIYILSSLYKKVYITKPCTSRTANSEKYIVCKSFKLDNTFELLTIFSNLYKIINTDVEILRFLNIDIPHLFINKIEDINAIIGQQQIENIISTLYLIDNNKHDIIENIKKNNIQKCIQWCTKYKIAHNKSVQQTNVFLYN